MTGNPLFDALFARHADCDTPFLSFADGTGLTYAGFLALADRLASALLEAGFAPGDRVAAQVEKSAASLALCAACTRTS
ncbi:AMP-binding protein [Chachezhania antarctica]|uniref:AMP-binding protein n=1 Tax=Chachezhania antarctica TaxID=2340860 RepID=UPI000EAE11FA|nr:AMP-binding protein [Chachezhania antarctica]|tara:strand:+ start:33 stop:269 length:237 start_codon:yes stop_codon:yes gene_type:complete